MLQDLKKIAESARFYLWPVAAGNTVAVALGVGAGSSNAVLLGVALCCLASFGFLINDLLDRRVDKANSAKRLEYARPQAISGAWGAAFLFLLVGLLCSLCVSTRCLQVCVWISLGLFLYSSVVRPILLAATILAALLGTSPLWVPLFLWRESAIPSVAALFSGVYLMFVAREIILDIKDEEGDRLSGRHTFPTIYGWRIASMLASTAKVASGGVLLKACFDLSSGISSLVSQLLLWLLVLCFLYLGIVPALKVSLASSPREMIAAYIRQSRVAMALLPIILLFVFCG